MTHATFSRRFYGVLMTLFLGVATTAGVLASPAGAVVHVEQYIEVAQCQPNTSQECPQRPEVKFTAGHNESIQLKFTANANHCSDILVRFLIDNYPQGDGYLRVGPSQTVSLGTTTKAGDRVLSVQAKGVEGGCNTGVLNAWGGTVHIDSDDADGPTPVAVGPAPHQVPVPCKWRYSGPVVIDQNNGIQVHLDQWNDLTAIGPAHLYRSGAAAPSERGDVLGAGPNQNGNPNELAFSIAWFDKDNNHVDTNDYDGEIDPQGTLRGTTTNNEGVKNDWGAHQHWTCS